MLSNSKLRPAVLISDPAACSGAVDGHFVFLTTQQPPAHLPAISVMEGSRAATAMGLRFPIGVRVAHVLPTKLATLEVALVQKQIGAAPAEILDQVLAILAPALGCVRHSSQPAAQAEQKP